MEDDAAANQAQVATSELVPASGSAELQQLLLHPAFQDVDIPRDQVKDVESLAALLEERQLWSPERLRVCAHAPGFTSLALAHDSELLDALTAEILVGADETATAEAEDRRQPGAWASLVYLELHDIKVTEAHIDRLARLRLDTLALCDCGLEMTHLARLLPLGRSLQALDLSGNPGVGDVALPALAFLPFLTFLDCKDTAVSMTGLRDFASAAAPLRRFPKVQISPPQECEAYLLEAKASKHYAFHINEPFLIVSEPGQVDQLDSDQLWENLAFHRRATQQPSLVTAKSEGQQDDQEDAQEARKMLKDLLRRRKQDLLVLDHCPVGDDEDPPQAELASQVKQLTL